MGSDTGEADPVRVAPNTGDLKPGRVTERIDEVASKRKWSGAGDEAPKRVTPKVAEVRPVRW